MIIYKATNKINGKVYIGQTIKTLNYRMDQHYRIAKLKKYNNYFHNALLKNKKIYFEWEIIDTANSIEDLNKKEIYWIELYNSINKKYGYNSKSGGSNGILVESSRKKQSQKMKGRIGFWLGQHHSEETKLKMSIAKRGRILSKEHKEKISQSEMGRIFKEETKLKIKNAKKKCIGEIGHKTVVNSNQVLLIREMIKNKIPDNEIMKIFNIKRSCFNGIKYNINWKHLL
jgi:group I intron endonuclease